jgi:Uma2 family endonuclease
MADAGLFLGRRVERIEGTIIERGPITSPQAGGISLVHYALHRVFTTGFVIRVQMPLELGLDSDPEPDVAVVAGSLRDFLASHPTTAVLVVEAAETSLNYDRRKGGLYAKGGIEEHWVVDLAGRRLEVYRQPRPDPTRPHGYAYASRQLLVPGDSISPLAAPGASIAVADLLP